MVGTSRAITDVAREYGIHGTTLGNWVRDYREKHGGETEAPLNLPERARLRELEREVRELQMKCDITWPACRPVMACAVLLYVCRPPAMMTARPGQ